LKVGVVIPCINLWERYTIPAINSLKSEQNELYVVVVDNGSTDITQQAARALISPTFGYIRNNTNLGCPTAWNQGTKKCIEEGCDYVLIINNDVLLHPEAIDRLVGKFEKSKEHIIGIKPREYGVWAEEWNDLSESAGYTKTTEFERTAIITMINVRGDCKDIPNNIFTLDPNAYVDTAEEEYPDFSGFMLSKNAYATIGEFDEGFSPAYFEDNDYHRRLKLVGLVAIKHPPALFYHYGSATRNESGTITVTDWSFVNSRAYFEAKWGGAPENDGSLGTRLHTRPFNDTKKSLQWNLQNRCKTGTCKCDVNCDKIYNWNKTKLSRFS